MIPYILAAVGGYLIGQSQKKDVPQMKKGGSIEDGDDVKMSFKKKTLLEIFESEDAELDNPVQEVFNEGEVFEVTIFGVDKDKYDVQFGDGSVSFIRKDDVNVIEVNGDKYAKGGKVKSKKWIQDALSGGDNKGALRRTAKRKGLLRGDENLSMTDLKKLEKMGGTTAKRAYMAETLRKFD